MKLKKIEIEIDSVKKLISIERDLKRKARLEHKLDMLELRLEIEKSREELNKLRKST